MPIEKVVGLGSFFYKKKHTETAVVQQASERGDNNTAAVMKRAEP